MHTPTLPRTRPLLPPCAALCLLLLVAGGGRPARLRAETTAYSGATQITALPATLSAPGTYYLAQDFSVNLASGSAIAIGAAGVTIDLNGHTITNTAGTTNTALAVYANTKDNLAVSNGSLNGFGYGVAVWGAGARFENLTCVQSTTSAILVYGSNARLHRCRALLTYGDPNHGSGAGFTLVGGGGSTVEDCEVCGKTGTGPVYGLSLSGSEDFVVNNRFSGVDYGVAGSNYKYRDNLTSGVATPYRGGTDAGNNN